jgi:predicted fused transcriptional regulator/phosphomethylpyrimidine kinase
MSLASFDPQEHNEVDRLGARIIIWAMDLLRHGGVVMKAVVDSGVGVGLEPVIRVVGDVGRRLALMSHSIGREGGARPATM